MGAKGEWAGSVNRGAVKLCCKNDECLVDSILPNRAVRSGCRKTSEARRLCRPVSVHKPFALSNAGGDHCPQRVCSGPNLRSYAQTASNARAIVQSSQMSEWRVQ